MSNYVKHLEVMNKVFCYLVISKTKLSAEVFKQISKRKEEREKEREIQIGETKIKDRKR